MGADKPKQFIDLEGVPIIVRTVMRLNDLLPRAKFVIPLIEGYEFSLRSHLTDLHDEGRLTICAGGRDRFGSVSNGLAFCAEEDFVFVHDAVRPFVSKELLERLYEAILTHPEKGIVPAIKLRDSIRKIDTHGSMGLDRSQYRLVQTPQVFRASELKSSYSNAQQKVFTDDASVFEANGGGIIIVDGEEDNIKITTQRDLSLARHLVLKEWG